MTYQCMVACSRYFSDDESYSYLAIAIVRNIVKIRENNYLSYILPHCNIPIGEPHVAWRHTGIET